MLDLLISISHLALIVLGFGALIFVHELGHFLAAKWANIRTEAFAIGMGPVVFAWRKGIGLRFRSTAGEYERRVREAVAKQRGGASGDKAPAMGIEEVYRVGDSLGLGETEYSLRWLPIGGFVKMLGQEDANPNYISSDPRSYQRCGIGKRMIVVSAGVIMNILLAMLLFVIAFMVGVKFDAPVVGDVSARLPAGRTAASNADSLGVTEPGLMPGDVVVAIDGQPARTFADIQIASAMSKPGVPVSLVVEREGVREPLRFELLPEFDESTRLLTIGVAPSSSTRLIDGNIGTLKIESELSKAGVAQAGVKPGMQLMTADGQPVRTFEQLERMIRAKDGESVTTQWQALNDRREPTGAVIDARVDAKPTYQTLVYADRKNAYEEGLLGMLPLLRVENVEADSLNAGVLQAGDVILRIGDVVAPSATQALEEIPKHQKQRVALVVWRNGEPVELTGQVNSKGQLEFRPGVAWDVPMIATPMTSVRVPADTSDGASEASAELSVVPTAIAPLNLMPGDRIVEINGQSIGTWADMREALRSAAVAAPMDEGASVELVVSRLFWEGDPERHALQLSSADCAALAKLGWTSAVPSYLFESHKTTLSAGGNPLTAVSMGVRETHKLIILVYLTIDRLFRGSVGVEQLRGPVGIVDLGSRIVPQGAMYFLFFLGMISVNLAVINFLPLPIVDGGLFLFLVYEKLKGQPPPVAFQNIATVVGLLLIGTLFLVTFYNDVMRLIT